jgi:uncharacterized protein (DUF885 family)
VKVTYLPAARTTIAAEALPDGPARYAARVRRQTTTGLDPHAIHQMRKEAEQRLGSAFDLRAFHDAVLESGPLPLDVLEEKMRTWTPAKR